MGIDTPEQLIFELNSLNDRINLDIRFESFTVWTDYEIIYLTDIFEFVSSFENSYTLECRYKLYKLLSDNGGIGNLNTVSETTNEVDMSTNDRALAAVDIRSSKETPNLWLGDTGASCHMTYSDEGMYDFQTTNSFVTIGDGRVMKTQKIGKKKLMVKTSSGKQIEIVLDNCKYIPDLHVNLFSITQAITNGWQLSNIGKMLTLKKNNITINFNNNLETKTGYVPGIYMDACLLVKDAVIDKLEINTAHKLLGHPNDDTLRRTAKENNITLTGTIEKCESCFTTKAKQKALSKHSDTKSKKPGERLCLDISSVNSTSRNINKFWLLIVDDATDYCWSYFLKANKIRFLLSLKS